MQGVPAERFYELASSDQAKDKLTSFVVQTILTVDDFLLFKVCGQTVAENVLQPISSCVPRCNALRRP